MDNYGVLAGVYDRFMDDVPYNEWAGFLHGIFKGAGIETGILLDIGCGTGRMTEWFAHKGYDMIGTDTSPDMLSVAMERKVVAGSGTLYLCQDVRNLDLYGTVDGAYASLDSLNYLIQREELVQAMTRVALFLRPGGLFAFDLNTSYKFAHVMEGGAYARVTPDAGYICESTYDRKTRLNTYAVTIFTPAGEGGTGEADGGTVRFDGGKAGGAAGAAVTDAGWGTGGGTGEADGGKFYAGPYARSQETHVQRAYTLAQVQRILSEVRLELMAVYDGYTMAEPSKNCERWLFVARKPRYGMV
ncbi:MAG: class I SAM-dependent methyltransferase [Lachnospiraceae bacterium]|jgi:SAM-dependent methyltransferase|nr:class I SAM-dependent methyltransferase [Lachnospiraceae bacterium]